MLAWIRGLFEIDFLPWANPYVRSPLTALCLAAVSGTLCGIFVSPTGYLFAGSILVIVLVGLFWPRLTMAGLRSKLTFSRRRANEQDAVQATLTLTNASPCPAWGLKFISDLSSAEQEAEVTVAMISGWSEVAYEWTFVPPQRGSYPRNAASLETGFPFGVGVARGEVEIERQLIVWPQRAELSALDLPSGAHPWHAEPSETMTGEMGDRSEVRPYRTGDSLRSFHWALTARHDRFIVNQRQGAAQSQVTLVVDPRPGPVDATGDPVGWVARAAASVLETLLRQGVQVALVLGETRLELRPGEIGFRSGMDALSKFEPAKRMTPFRSTGCPMLITANATTAAEFSGRSILVSGDDEPHPRVWIDWRLDKDPLRRLERLWAAQRWGHAHAI